MYKKEHVLTNYPPPFVHVASERSHYWVQIQNGAYTFFEFAQNNSLGGFLRFHQDLENLINFIGTWCQFQFYKTLSILWSAQHQTLNKKVSKVMKVSHDSKRRKSSVIYFWKCFSCDLESVTSEKWSLNVNLYKVLRVYTY